MADPGPGEVRSRILLVDDHPVVRVGLARLLALEPDLEVCGERDSAAQVAGAIRELAPDLVLLDLSLGSESGLELIKRLRARGEDVYILVSSMHDEEIFAERVLAAGAEGYIEKAQAAEDIVEAVRRVLRGEIYLSRRMTERMLRRAAGHRASEQDAADPVDQLSDRELEVFGLIGRGLSTRKIAERLNVSRKTVETHRERIKTKLDIEDAPQLVRRAVMWSEKGWNGARRDG